ncbi:UDP-galactopyranose mutase [Rubellicoccus peritrichatus]|uniref:UDP-galactopyranose mutase n=1 Tax=Rubellicoccus peritrichatus TaxID=3080537 RepID=A0AAQ3QW72_9BACT|nr:UDP-galactopyranose mutase [Puniceicoccus sp. CR14]WOO41597.1 UDP-galactopyranose mutase [Puniceicoccus sp. CR14]
MPWKFDYLIVGAGFSGLVMAERITNTLGKTCLVVEKRDHIGGNAHDEYSDAGVLYHPYGPHYFRTNSPKIKEYLSRFTEWHEVKYQVSSFTEGRYWSFPINLKTFEQLIGRESTTEEFEAWIAEKRVPIDEPVNSEEVIISQVGQELYKKFFEGYTLKQWRRHPRDLDKSVCGRIPIRTNRDDRYLREEFQALPKHGYRVLFRNLARACGNKLKILLNTDYREVCQNVDFEHLVFTGAIDEFYDYKFGRLPYRSLRFEVESFEPTQLRERVDISGKQGFWQPTLQVNYPNEHDYTRIVEMKHATGQATDNSTIVREFPEDFGPGKEPYYPIPAADSATIYRQYEEMAKQEKKVTFVGRLATYRYYNMDQVVGMALKRFEDMAKPAVV